MPSPPPLPSARIPDDQFVGPHVAASYGLVRLRGPKRRSGGKARVTVNPCVDEMDLTAAVFVIGDYPQVPWREAVQNLKRRIVENGWNEINPMTLWLAERKRTLELLKAKEIEEAE